MSSYLNNDLSSRLLGGMYRLVMTVIKLSCTCYNHYLIKFFESYFKWLLQEITVPAVTEVLVPKTRIRTPLLTQCKERSERGLI
jgi:hypothetical protein